MRMIVHVVVFAVLLDAGSSSLPRAEIRECPSLCRCLEKGSIITCRHAGLHRLPDLLSTTMFLDFDHNNVATIRNGTFVETPRVEMISLQDNQIQIIEPGTLTGLSELHTLLLGKNSLISLPADLFWGTPRLEILDLHDNLFTIIPDYLLQPLHSLQSFNLSQNHLDSVHLGNGFTYTKQLRILDLSNNNFVSLEQRAFRVIRAWDENVPHSLNLSNCNIHHIHVQTMRNFHYLDSLSLARNPAISPSELQASIQDLATSKLQRINLSGVNISDIHQFFRNFQHDDLLYLDLSFNQITKVERGTFYYLESLQHLDLSHNHIRSIDDFSTLNRLTYLDLSHNQLHYLDSTALESLHALRTLDISHNSLTQVDDEPFLDLFDLHLLDISCNKISRIMITSGMESLQELNAHDNILSDLGFISRLRHLQILDLSQNVVQQLGPSFLPKGQHLEMLNLSSNLIHHVDANTFHASTQGTVDLSHNKLSSLSYPSWAGIRKLYLQNNMLYNLTANTFNGLTALTHLHLSSNHLVALSKNTFKDLINLKVLDLRHNPLGTFLSIPDAPQAIGLDGLNSLQELLLSNIDIHEVPLMLLANLTMLTKLDMSRNYVTELSSTSLSHLRHLSVIDFSDNQIQTVSPLLFQSFKKDLKLVDLSMNPFECTCDLMPFRSWAISTLSDTDGPSVANLHDTVKYQCFSPPEWKGVPLLNFHLDTGSCSAQERAVLLAAIACIVLALSLTIIIAVLRYKWYRRRKLETRRSTVQEYTFVDDSSTAALTGNQSLSMNSTTHTIKEWV